MSRNPVPVQARAERGRDREKEERNRYDAHPLAWAEGGGRLGWGALRPLCCGVSRTTPSFLRRRTWPGHAAPPTWTTWPPSLEGQDRHCGLRSSSHGSVALSGCTSPRTRAGVFGSWSTPLRYRLPSRSCLLTGKHMAAAAWWWGSPLSWSANC